MCPKGKTYSLPCFLPPSPPPLFFFLPSPSHRFTEHKAGSVPWAVTKLFIGQDRWKGSLLLYGGISWEVCVNCPYLFFFSFLVIIMRLLKLHINFKTSFEISAKMFTQALPGTGKVSRSAGGTLPGVFRRFSHEFLSFQSMCFVICGFSLDMRTSIPQW